MEDILDIIKSRRSVRRYSDKVPSKANIEKVLEAGRWAPSGLNNQPWRFLPISDKKKKEGLAEFTKYGDIIRNAPLAIVVTIAMSNSYNRDKDIMAMGSCIQNMLLEAHSLGLCSCWLGEILNKKKEVSEYLDLDPDLELMAVVTLGYPKERGGKGERKPLKELIIGPLKI